MPMSGFRTQTRAASRGHASVTPAPRDDARLRAAEDTRSFIIAAPRLAYLRDYDALHAFRPRRHDEL